MCRSIKTLRPPFVDEASDEDTHAAALQYVRKISGMRSPSRANTEVFERAVLAVSSATQDLLAELELRPRPKAPATEAGQHTG